ncbi:MAG: hypothetical protein NVSMB13_17630 [Mycobacteriales bacterium]
MTATIPPRSVSGGSGSPLLSIAARSSDRELRLHLVGELDDTTVDLLRAAALARPRGVDVLVLELDELTFADARAIRTFRALDRELKASGGRLVLVNPTTFLLRLLHLVGFDVTLDIRARES